MRMLSAHINELLLEGEAKSVEAARLDSSFREAWAMTLLEAKADREARYTNDEAKAYADVKTIKARTDAKVAEALADANKQALQARRTQVSALQSIASALREEAAFGRTTPF
jgi:hypothetical protein